MEQNSLFSKKQIWSLIIPLMVEQFLNSLMGTADTVMVTASGAESISAVSLVDSINIMVILIFSAMATGGSILVSQTLGNKQVEKANHIGKQLILSVTFISVVGTAICIILKNPILNIIFGKVEPKVMENARIYFLITALSYPFIALYNAGAAIFRADKNSKLPMTISTISNFINIGGNAILIFGFNLNVVGAAISTLASRMFCAITVLIFLNRTNQVIKIDNFLKIKPDLKTISKILNIGVPTGIENGMFQFGKLAIQSTVSTMGTAAIAANAMTAMLESLSCQAAQGIGLGMMTIVGQCIGAGEDEQATKYIKKLTFYGFVAIAISSAAVSLIVTPLTALSQMEKEVALIAIHLTWIVHIVKPFSWTWSFLPAYGLRAAGDVKFSMMVSLITMWSCRVMTVIVLARCFHFGPLAVWIGMMADWSVRSICFMVRFKSRKWLRHRI